MCRELVLSLRMRKLVLALTLLAAFAGTVYAGCFTTANFNPSTVNPNDAPRLMLQCYALRSGGSWSIAGDGRSATKAGGSTYTATAPVCSSGTCTLDVKLGSSTRMRTFYTSTVNMPVFAYDASPTENGTCQVYFQVGGNVFADNPGGPNVVTRVKYCR